MATPQVQNVMMLTDDHVDAIRRAIERTRAPVEVSGDGGRRAVFKIRGGKLYGYEHTATGVVKHEVMKESQMRSIMARPDVTRPDPLQLEKDELRRQLRSDKPEMSNEKLDEHVDIIIEARKTMLRLIQQGIAPNVASKMISAALKMSEEDRDSLQRLSETYRREDAGHTSAAVPSHKEVADPMSGEF